MLDSIAVQIFICSVAAVYVLAACALVRMLLRRAGWMSASSRRTLWAERVVLACVGVLCFAYGYFVEPYWPQVTRARVESDRLAGATRPVRVVHISDLHCDPAPRLEERLPALVAAERPDIIVFTGDSLNSPEGLPVLKPLLKRLAEVAPTFAVRGNWDVWYWGRQDLFGGTGVRELNGAAEKVEIKDAGASVWVAGAAYGGLDAPLHGPGGKITRALRDVPAGAPVIFLYHTPDEILDIAATNRVDLYCAGHTHGGQVALPFYGALITFSKFGKKYEAGLYRESTTWLYVNRGLGMEGGHAPRVRFWARPEITVIEMVKPGEQ
jgi:predicted MPP superfamily phosphohydrolase